MPHPYEEVFQPLVWQLVSFLIFLIAFLICKRGLQEVDNEPNHGCRVPCQETGPPSNSYIQSLKEQMGFQYSRDVTGALHQPVGERARLQNVTGPPVTTNNREFRSLHHLCRLQACQNVGVQTTSGEENIAFAENLNAADAASSTPIPHEGPVEPVVVEKATATDPVEGEESGFMTGSTDFSQPNITGLETAERSDELSLHGLPDNIVDDTAGRVLGDEDDDDDGCGISIEDDFLEEVNVMSGREPD